MFSLAKNTESWIWRSHDITTKKGNVTAGQMAGRWYERVFFAHGSFVIATEHFHGKTKQAMGVSVDGQAAVVLGLGIIIIGLTPMAVWAGSAKAAGFWVGSCMTLGVLLMLVPFYMSHALQPGVHGWLVRARIRIAREMRQVRANTSFRVSDHTGQRSSRSA
jgi:hypothetical protein